MSETAGAQVPASARDLAEREGALLRLLSRHERSLRRTARRYSLCSDDAEDALQRALEVALTKAPVDTDLELLRWTQTVTKHEALAVRHQRERLLDGAPADSDPGDPGDPLDALASEGLEPTERIERNERVARSCEALTSLKPQELRALTLKAEGFSYAEIQAITGWTYTKVNRCMAEGRKRFLTVFDRIEGGDRCEELAGEVSLLCDGELEPDREREVRRHLRGCAHCRAKVGIFRGLPRRVLELTPPALPLASTWWMRAQEAVWAGTSERVIGSTVKAHQLLELAGAKKAMAVVGVSAAAVASGGAAVTDSVPGSEGDRAAIERPVAEREPDAVRSAPPAPPASPSPHGSLASDPPRRAAPLPSPAPPQEQAPQPSGPEAEFGGAEGDGEGGGEFANRQPSSSPASSEFGAPAGGAAPAPAPVSPARSSGRAAGDGAQPSSGGGGGEFATGSGGGGEFGQ